MTTTALVSVFSSDKTGLVAAITSSLFDLGINLATTTFSVLGTGAEFTAVAELPDDLELTEVTEALNDLDLPEGAKVSVTPFKHDTSHGPSGRITHRVTVSGGDRPGLIARLCEVFGQYKANIVRMNAERMPGQNEDQYVIRFAVWLSETNANTCLATIANTAGEMRLNCVCEEA